MVQLLIAMVSNYFYLESPKKLCQAKKFFVGGTP